MIKLSPCLNNFLLLCNTSTVVGGNINHRTNVKHFRAKRCTTFFNLKCHPALPSQDGGGSRFIINRDVICVFIKTYHSSSGTCGTPKGTPTPPSFLRHWRRGQLAPTPGKYIATNLFHTLPIHVGQPVKI